jgi:hypothetical protein
MPDGRNIDVSLRDYIEAMLVERDRRYDLHIENAKALVDGARRDMERRMELLNQLRQAVEQDRAQFVKWDIYRTKMEYYDEWCRCVDRKLTTIQTRNSTWMTVVCVVFAIAQVVVYFIR